MIIFNNRHHLVRLGQEDRRVDKEEDTGRERTEDKTDHLEMGSKWRLWSREVRNVVANGGDLLSNVSKISCPKLGIMTTGN